MNRLWARLRRSAEFRAARLARGVSQPSLPNTPPAQPRPIAPSEK